MNWKETLNARLPFYGHRNWIVVADSAYPEQSSPGIETLVSGAAQTEVLEQVFASLSASEHVRPNVYIDRELEFVSDRAAAGASAYRAQLSALLQDQRATPLPHEEIIAQLDQAGQTFKILLIKTTMTIPYTSVFLQLDCAYWDAESEQALRASMQAHS
ncbi:MAG: hypothetical protein P4K98_03990 [Bryobacteraceae bacterium]|nr:hypothetical protein [Bryobacteraceae bacterium]